MRKPYLHFSHKPLTEVYDVSQLAFPSMKPQGLWFSVGDAWAEFHKSVFSNSRSRSRELDYCTRVWLKPGKIVRIKTPEEFDEFTDNYLDERDPLHCAETDQLASCG